MKHTKNLAIPESDVADGHVVPEFSEQQRRHVVDSIAEFYA